MEDKTIIVNLKYIGTDFFGRSELSKEGTILWAGHEILNFIGEDEPEWDEIIVVNYTEENLYNNALKQLAEEDRLSSYKILLIRNYPQEVIDRVNKMSYKESSVDTTRGELITDDLEWGGVNQTREKLDEILQRDKNEPIVMLNIVKYRDIAKYPESYEGEKNISGEDAYKIYGKNSAKVQGMPMVNVIMDLAGVNVATIVGNEPDWDHYFFARYPSLEYFINMSTSIIYRQGVIHRTAYLFFKIMIKPSLSNVKYWINV